MSKILDFFTGRKLAKKLKAFEVEASKNCDHILAFDLTYYKGDVEKMREYQQTTSVMGERYMRISNKYRNSSIKDRCEIAEHWYVWTLAVWQLLNNFLDDQLLNKISNESGRPDLVMPLMPKEEQKYREGLIEEQGDFINKYLGIVSQKDLDSFTEKLLGKKAK